jgi:hypothetical protein
MHKHIPPPDNPWWNVFKWPSYIQATLVNSGLAAAGFGIRNRYKKMKDNYKSSREAEQVRLPKRWRKK